MHWMSGSGSSISVVLMLALELLVTSMILCTAGSEALSMISRLFINPFSSMDVSCRLFFGTEFGMRPSLRRPSCGAADRLTCRQGFPYGTGASTGRGRGSAMQLGQQFGQCLPCAMGGTGRLTHDPPAHPRQFRDVRACRVGEQVATGGIGPVGDGLQPLGPVLGRDIGLLPWIVAPFGGLSVHDLRTGGTARLGQPGVHEHVRQDGPVRGPLGGTDGAQEGSCVTLRHECDRRTRTAVPGFLLPDEAVGLQARTCHVACRER